MNPPANINESITSQKALAQESDQPNSPDLINWRKLVAYGSAVVAAVSLGVGSLTMSEQSSEKDVPAGVKFVHSDEGTFLQHRVEPGDTIWEIARSFQQASPELADKDPREVVDAIVETRGGDTLLIPDQMISLPLSDNPENPANS